jgi:hypothetical protein
MSLSHLIYISTAARDFDLAGLEQILGPARERNEGLGVTGILLYGRGCFIQVLEGEDWIVRRLVDRIQLDERHHSLRVLQFAPIEVRTFESWLMGCISLEACDDSIRKRLEPDLLVLASCDGLPGPTRTLELIRTFREALALAA